LVRSAVRARRAASVLALIGHHGSLTEAERLVPLFVAPTS